jgi:hypothetical protein
LILPSFVLYFLPPSFVIPNLYTNSAAEISSKMSVGAHDYAVLSYTDSVAQLFSSLLTELGVQEGDKPGASAAPTLPSAARRLNSEGLSAAGNAANMKRKSVDDLTGPKEKAPRFEPEIRSRGSSPVPKTTPATGKLPPVSKPASRPKMSGSESSKLPTPKLPTSKPKPLPAVSDTSSAAPPPKGSYAEILARAKRNFDKQQANKPKSIFEITLGEAEEEQKKMIKKKMGDRGDRRRGHSRSRSGSTEPGYGSARVLGSRVSKAGYKGMSRPSSLPATSSRSTLAKKLDVKKGAKADPRKKEAEEPKRPITKRTSESTYKGTANLKSSSRGTPNAPSSSGLKRRPEGRQGARSRRPSSSGDDDEEEEEDDYFSDDLSDMEAGILDLAEEEELALRAAKAEDAAALREENELRRQKQERLAKLARDTAAKNGRRNFANY